MSRMSQTPTPEFAMNAITRESQFRSGPVSGAGAGCPATQARLQAIHRLVRSGDYHVPAAAIADRMVEQMLAKQRGR